MKNRLRESTIKNKRYVFDLKVPGVMDDTPFIEMTPEH